MGYDLRMHGEANYLEGVMVTRVAQRKDQKLGAKKGAMKVEADTIRAGKLLLRQAITTIRSAIRTRPTREGQTAGDRAEETKTLMARLDALGGGIRYETTTLRSKLESASSMIELPAIAGRVADLQCDRNLKAEITAMIAKLPTVSGTKETEKKRAIEETAALDVLDGLMYLNLKALVNAGRDHFAALGDTTTAAQFRLDVLNRTPGTAATPAKPPAPVA